MLLGLFLVGVVKGGPILHIWAGRNAFGGHWHGHGAYHSSLSAREAVRLLVRGQLAPLFFGSVILLDLAAPLALTALPYTSGTISSGRMWLAALLGTQGALSCRWVILQAGVYAPPRY